MVNQAKIIESELNNLLRYLTRDASWAKCFDVVVNADNFTKRMKGIKIVRLAVWSEGVTDEMVSKMVADICLMRGLRVFRGGVEIEMVKKEPEDG